MITETNLLEVSIDSTDDNKVKPFPMRSELKRTKNLQKKKVNSFLYDYDDNNYDDDDEEENPSNFEMSACKRICYSDDDDDDNNNIDDEDLIITQPPDKKVSFLIDDNSNNNDNNNKSIDMENNNTKLAETTSEKTPQNDINLLSNITRKVSCSEPAIPVTEPVIPTIYIRRDPSDDNSNKNNEKIQINVNTQKSQQNNDSDNNASKNKIAKMPRPDPLAFDDEFDLQLINKVSATPQLVRNSILPSTPLKCPNTPARTPSVSRINFGAPSTVGPISAFRKRLGPSTSRVEYNRNSFDEYVKIGQGSFGEVYRVRCIKNNQYYALKISTRQIPYDYTPNIFNNNSNSNNSSHGNSYGGNGRSGCLTADAVVPPMLLPPRPPLANDSEYDCCSISSNTLGKLFPSLKNKKKNSKKHVTKNTVTLPLKTLETSAINTNTSVFKTSKKSLFGNNNNDDNNNNNNSNNGDDDSDDSDENVSSLLETSLIKLNSSDNLGINSNSSDDNSNTTSKKSAFAAAAVPPSSSSSASTYYINKEVERMSTLHHKNILSIVQAWTEADRRIYILTDLCECSLMAYLRELWIKDKGLSEDQILSYAYDIFSGVNYLHKNKVMHLDLKPDNLLLFNGKKNVKVGDFGLAFQVGKDNKNTLMEGDNKYMALELLNDNYGFPADVFSLGITLYEMSIPKIELQGNGPRWKALRNNDIDFSMWQHSEELKELVTWMLKADPKERPTMEQLVSHKIFDKLNNKKGSTINKKSSAMIVNKPKP